MRCLTGFVVIAALALGACSRPSRPAHFFAEGRPAKLSDWQMVYADGGKLALNTGRHKVEIKAPDPSEMF